MTTLMMLVAALATTPATPDGSRLRAGTQCFTIQRGGAAVGRTLQVIRATRDGGRPAWDIVVHQRQDDGRFDMRDHFVVDRQTLRPIAFDSARGLGRDDRGWHRIALRYNATRIVGSRETKDGTKTIDVALDKPVWDGNLWGVTFASLPLRTGRRLSLPFWQYDKGFGTFTVNVVGQETATIAGRKVATWILEAGDVPARLARYVVAAGGPMEIGYSAGPFGQRLGGDCGDLIRREATGRSDAAATPGRNVEGHRTRTD